MRGKLTYKGQAKRIMNQSDASTWRRTLARVSSGPSGAGAPVSTTCGPAAEIRHSRFATRQLTLLAAAAVVLLLVLVGASPAQAAFRTCETNIDHLGMDGCTIVIGASECSLPCSINGRVTVASTVGVHKGTVEVVGWDGSATRTKSASCGPQLGLLNFLAACTAITAPLPKLAGGPDNAGLVHCSGRGTVGLPAGTVSCRAEWA